MCYFCKDSSHAIYNCNHPDFQVVYQQAVNERSGRNPWEYYRWLNHNLRLRELKCIASNLGSSTNRRFHQLAGEIVIQMYFRVIPTPEENLQYNLYYRFLYSVREGIAYNEAINVYLRKIHEYRQVIQRQTNERNQQNRLTELFRLGQSLVERSPQYYTIIHIINRGNPSLIERYFGEGITMNHIFEAIPCICNYYANGNEEIDHAEALMDELFSEIFNDVEDEDDDYEDVVKTQKLAIHCKTTSFFVSMQECGICYETSTARLQCSHEFCVDCIDTYLTNIKKDHRTKPTCPMCRSDITIIETDKDHREKTESSIYA